MDRTVETILNEWRACEQELAFVLDEVEMAELLARIEILREAHRVAVAGRDALARDLAKRAF